MSLCLRHGRHSLVSSLWCRPSGLVICQDFLHFAGLSHLLSATNFEGLTRSHHIHYQSNSDTGRIYYQQTRLHYLSNRPRCHCRSAPSCCYLQSWYRPSIHRCPCRWFHLSHRINYSYLHRLGVPCSILYLLLSHPIWHQTSMARVKLLTYFLIDFFGLQDLLQTHENHLKEDHTSCLGQEPTRDEWNSLTDQYSTKCRCYRCSDSLSLR